MENAKTASAELGIAEQETAEQLQQAAESGFKIQVIFKKLRGGFLLVIGYLLSPLCWWNDLFFNLPIAYFFGYVCSLLSPNLLLPCSIIGYWLSNIIGILLMQLGAVDVFQGQPKERNLKKELLTGLVSSTVYTLVILALIQFKILDTPVLFSGA
jgi:Zn-dependent protease with chaperone function